MNLKFFFLKIMKGKNSQIFLLKKVGGALIRGGALNRDYTVFSLILGASQACIQNFRQIGQETEKLWRFIKIFECSGSRGHYWPWGRCQKMKIAISYSFGLNRSTCLTSIPNFIEIGWKTKKLRHCSLRSARAGG